MNNLHARSPASTIAAMVRMTNSDTERVSSVRAVN
jgi:hypothetical protein